LRICRAGAIAIRIPYDEAMNAKAVSVGTRATLPTIGRMARATGTKLIAENRRARHDYELLDRYEAGLVLTGTEVKSLREGRVTLGQAYADVRGTEAWLIGAEIAEYTQGNSANHEPKRDRKLLLKRHEIDTLLGKVREKGLTLVPTRLYFKDGRVKLELAVARGKERIDKRRDLAAKDAKRQIERALKSRR
jgi:SsrA-binding protein